MQNSLLFCIRVEIKILTYLNSTTFSENLHQVRSMKNENFYLIGKLG